MSTKSSEIKDLAALLRADWNRRIRLDRRMWMSEAVESDDQMLASGERDLLLLLGSEISNTANKRVLEIGCGVGRMLVPAAGYFDSVIGVDVSDEAVAAANQLISTRELQQKVQAILVDGTNLAQIGDSSIDLIFSYGTLGIMPSRVLARCLAESHRVLRRNGSMRVQLYLGREQPSVEEDTLAVRAYDRDRFTRACAAGGFELSSAEELIHPIGNVSKPAEGIIAHIVSLRKTGESPLDTETIEAILLENPEQAAGESWAGSQLEYQMAITRAQKLVIDRQLPEARALFEYAADHYKHSDDIIDKVLTEINRVLESNE